MSDRITTVDHWTIAVPTVQRLWPLIDVYGRIERALGHGTTPVAVDTRTLVASSSVA